MKRVDVNTLKVGDKVWYTLYPEYGWNNYCKEDENESKKD